MARIESYKDILVWQKAHDLALHIYKITNKFPSEEKYGLVSQMRRAATSVPINIVEGFRRISARESLRFYDISNTSLEELRYEPQISSDLEYLDFSEIKITNAKLEEVSKMLNA